MNDLVLQAKDGNAEAFCKLIKIMENSLYKIAKSKLNNEQDIEDAVQETIILAFQHIKDLKKPEYFKTWLIKILINKCYSIYNSRKQHLTEEYSENINLHMDVENNSVDKVNDSLFFNFLMKQLNDDERIALTLYYVENLTNKEIGNILEEKEGTVKSRISRGRKKLKKYLEEVYYE